MSLHPRFSRKSPVPPLSNFRRERDSRAYLFELTNMMTLQPWCLESLKVIGSPHRDRIVCLSEDGRL